MIHEVDSALGELLRSEAVAGGAEVLFDAPTKDWAARRNSPTIDVFLYDIREDVTRRDVQLQAIHNDEGRVIDRRPPPRRFKLSYLITAWTRRPEDEHRLLSQLLSTLLRHDRIPPKYLSGPIRELNLPVLLHLALPAGQDRSLSDIWSALGGELKPSLDLVAIAPIDPGRIYPVGPPVLEEPHLRVRRTTLRELEERAATPVPPGGLVAGTPEAAEAAAAASVRRAKMPAGKEASKAGKKTRPPRHIEEL